MGGIGRVDVEVAACFCLGTLSERGPCLSSQSRSSSRQEERRHDKVLRCAALHLYGTALGAPRLKWHKWIQTNRTGGTEGQ